MASQSGKTWTQIIDWPRTRSRIATGLGITPRAVGRMDLREALELLAYWHDHPPTHEVIYNAYFQRDENRHASTSATSTPSNVTQPRKLEDFMGIPGLGPPQQPVRKLLRFPIKVPGEAYVDRTPKSVDLHARPS